MLNKTTTLVLLASLTAAQGIFASDVTKDLTSDALSSPRPSSSTMLVEGDEVLTSVGVFANLDDIQLDELVQVPDSFEILKNCDQNVNKNAGKRVKEFFEEKVPGGKMLARFAGFIGQKAFGTETFTEGALDSIRKPLKIDPKDYPTTSEALIGKKIQLLINLIPGGEKITAVTGKAGQVFFKTDTLTEGLLKALIKYFSKKSQESEAKIEPSTEKAVEADKSGSN
ncbi:MAG: hypothetical protein BGO77_02620 [Caedibacter sp. 37-49]|nr:MAG: hypothetical protein BGO77_02620 [Caedibacter sp. 37-49]